MNGSTRPVLLLVAVVMLTAGGPGLTASPAPQPLATLTVYPTNLHPQDSLNVQAALDTVASPGTVILKSTNTGGTPTPFNFGGTDPGTGAVIRLLRPNITLTGDGWDNALDEPKTNIVGGGGAHVFSTGVSGVAMVFAIQAAGVTIRELKINSPSAAYTCFYLSAPVGQPSVDTPVVLERNDVSVMNYGVISAYTAAFPVRIHRNAVRAYVGMEARWLGFALAPLSAYPYSEPVPPANGFGAVVRHDYTVTENVFIVEPGTDGAGIFMWGWGNAYSQSPDPDVGVRRLRPNSTTPWTYQYVQGDNGPVLIDGNVIAMNSPDNYPTAIVLGGGSVGLNNSLTRGNRITGHGAVGIERFPFGRRNVIEANDLSDLHAFQQVSIDAADTTLAGNVFGPVVPLPAEAAMPVGLPQPAVALISVEYVPDYVPTPNPVANCALVKNDYRRTGLRAGAVLVASQAEIKWPFYFGTETGGEVMNNLIFESGGFIPGTGQAGNQILLIAGMDNPATGMPYVHDNRVVGLPARTISHPGIGQVVRTVMQLRKAPDLRSIPE